MEQQTFDLLLLTMSALAVVVFAALYYVRAGYGMFQTSKWGISLNNKLGWILMEAPVFFVMLYLWWNSSVRCSAVPLVFFLLFELHYFQRAFIFPFLMKGKSRMPIAIMLMRFSQAFCITKNAVKTDCIFFVLFRFSFEDFRSRPSTPQAKLPFLLTLTLWQMKSSPTASMLLL